MTEQPVGPRCGNNPHARLTPGDRKVLDDFRARLALEAAAKPHIEAAAWVDGDPLMEVIAVTLWRHCARDDKDMPQAVCDDPRTIAAFAAAVARAQADDEPAVPSVSVVDQTTRDRIAEARVRALHQQYRFAGDDTTDYCARCNQISGGWIPWPCPTVRALDGGRLADEVQQPAVGARQPDTETLVCVCGAPAEWMDVDVAYGSGWIHSPGSDTPCLDARPRCPECQMPHALTPSMRLACASIRASIADRDASSAVPGRSAATGTGEEQARG